jgi:hypothetical protein
MVFLINKMSTATPGVTMRLQPFTTRQIGMYGLLLIPPAMAMQVGTQWDGRLLPSSMDNQPGYTTELMIVDGRGRTALLYFADLGGKLYVRGNIGGGVVALEPVQASKQSGWWIRSPKRAVGLHLTEEGSLSVRAVAQYRWRGADGGEVDDIVIGLPGLASSSIVQKVGGEGTAASHDQKRRGPPFERPPREGTGRDLA